MGNFFDCMGKNHPQRISIEEQQMSFISTQSITNCSIPSKDDTASAISPPSSITTNSSYKFSWYRLQSIYLDPLQKTTSSHNQIIKIQPEVIKIMRTIFAEIKNNISQMSETFYNCLTEMDKTISVQFEEYAGRNLKSVTEGKALTERIRSHIISVIHIHTIILNSLQNQEFNKANDIIKLIALSHVLMKIKPTLFNLLDMVTTKFLLKAKLLCDETAEAVVIYFNFVTTSILNNMKVADNSDTDNSHKAARENYRHMKRWYKFLEDLRKEIKELNDLDTNIKTSTEEVEQKTSLSTIPTEILKQDTCFYKFFTKMKQNKKSVDD